MLRTALFSFLAIVVFIGFFPESGAAQQKKHLPTAKPANRSFGPSKSKGIPGTKKATSTASSRSPQRSPSRSIAKADRQHLPTAPSKPHPPVAAKRSPSSNEIARQQNVRTARKFEELVRWAYEPPPIQKQPDRLYGIYRSDTLQSIGGADRTRNAGYRREKPLNPQAVNHRSSPASPRPSPARPDPQSLLSRSRPHGPGSGSQDSLTRDRPNNLSLPSSSRRDEFLGNSAKNRSGPGPNVKADMESLRNAVGYKGECTWGVGEIIQRRGLSYPRLPDTHNAARWYRELSRPGFAKSSDPRGDAVMVLSGSGLPKGHVGVVRNVNTDGSWVVDHWNWGGETKLGRAKLYEGTVFRFSDSSKTSVTANDRPGMIYHIDGFVYPQ
jgi:surface antigen